MCLSLYVCTVVCELWYLRNTWNIKWNKKKIEHTGWWNKWYLKKVRCKFNDFRTKMYILWKTAWLWKKRALRLSAKEKINEIKRLKEEAENNKDKLLDYLLDGENKLNRINRI